MKIASSLEWPGPTRTIKLVLESDFGNSTRFSIRLLTRTSRLLVSRFQIQFCLSSLPDPSWLPTYPPTAWAKICYLAAFAVRFKRRAAATAMPDQPMAEIGPICPWYEAHQILLDLFGFSSLG
jgi:hypothetical protein